MTTDAYWWYEERSSGLGELFLQELDTCYPRLRTQPEWYHKSEKDFRQLTLKKFPYVIAFKIIQTDVVVYAVFHTKRNPNDKLRD